jgi:hypothetical protein
LNNHVGRFIDGFSLSELNFRNTYKSIDSSNNNKIDVEEMVAFIESLMADEEEINKLMKVTKGVN